LIKLALPAGDNRAQVAQVLSAVGISVDGYGEGSRSYRLPASRPEGVAARVFRERDIPIQVALGNYHIGICAAAWVKEMQARFPDQPIVPLCNLGAGASALLVATSEGARDLANLPLVRMASEFPNLAEAFCIAARLPRYRIQPVWGAAEAYPPEDADVVLVAASGEPELRGQGLDPVFRLLESSTWLIANRDSLQNASLARVLAPLIARGRPVALDALSLPAPFAFIGQPKDIQLNGADALRLAVPDGHQQRHVVDALRSAGMQFQGYDESTCARRPGSDIAGLDVKVVRPQDMPQLVALGQVDLAITGRDCLMEHLYRFPSSPVAELVDLARGQYDLSAVVSEDVPADNISQALSHWRQQGVRVLRVASEFAGTADQYALSRHLPRYQVIPIAGASEGFVPEDAELLIEGTETGKTLRENRLKPIDLLYRSTTCLIGHKQPSLSGRRRKVFEEIVSALRRAAGDQ